MKTVTLSALVADTGETPRTLNHWTDLGILRPLPSTDRAGRGNRRHYAAEPLYGERKYALLASAFMKLRLPLADIKHLIYAQRLMLDPLDAIDYMDRAHKDHAKRIRDEREEDRKKYPGFIEPFEAALNGEPDIYTVIAKHDDPKRPWHSVYLRQAGGDKWTDPDMPARANNKLMLSVMADTTSAVVLNLSKIFAPLYTKPQGDDHGGEDDGADGR